MNKAKSMRLTKPIVLVALFLMLVLAFTLCSIQVNDFAEQIFEVAGIEPLENMEVEQAEAATIKYKKPTTDTTQAPDLGSGATSFSLNLAKDVSKMGRIGPLTRDGVDLTDPNSTYIETSYSNTAYFIGTTNGSNTYTYLSSAVYASVCYDIDLGPEIEFLLNNGANISLNFSGSTEYKSIGRFQSCLISSSSTSIFNWSETETFLYDMADEDYRGSLDANVHMMDNADQNQRTGTTSGVSTGRMSYETSTLKGRYIRFIFTIYDEYKSSSNWFGYGKINIASCTLTINGDIESTAPTISTVTPAVTNGTVTKTGATYVDAEDTTITLYDNYSLYGWSYTYSPYGSSNITSTKSGTIKKHSTSGVSTTITLQNGIGKYAVTATDYCGNSYTKNIYCGGMSKPTLVDASDLIWTANGRATIPLGKATKDTVGKVFDNSANPFENVSITNNQIKFYANNVATSGASHGVMVIDLDIGDISQFGTVTLNFSASVSTTGGNSSVSSIASSTTRFTTTSFTQDQYTERQYWQARQSSAQSVDAGEKQGTYLYNREDASWNASFSNTLAGRYIRIILGYWDEYSPIGTTTMTINEFSITPSVDPYAPTVEWTPYSTESGKEMWTANPTITINDKGGSFLNTYSYKYYPSFQTNQAYEESSNTYTSNEITSSLTLPEMGAYVFTVTDKHNNTSTTTVKYYGSQQTFNYYATTYGLDGTRHNSDSTGGGVVFDTDSGYGASASKSGGIGTPYTLWATVNAGYYFAGFEFEENPMSINNAFSNYSGYIEETLEYAITFGSSYYPSSEDRDGIINVYAVFKPIPSTLSITYNGSPQDYPLSISSISGETINLVTTYTAFGNDTTKPTYAGEYALNARIHVVLFGTPYYLSAQTACTHNIRAKDVKIVPAFSNVDRYYDSYTTLTPTVAWSVLSSDICGSDDIGVSTVNGTFTYNYTSSIGGATIASAGTHYISMAYENLNIALSSASADVLKSYNPIGISYANDSQGKILPRPITFSVKAITRYYGAEEVSLTNLDYYLEQEGAFATGENYATVGLSLSRATGNSVGKYKYTLTKTIVNNNYALTLVDSDDDATRVYNIVKRPIIITANSLSKTYGDADVELTWVDSFNGTESSVGIIPADKENFTVNISRTSGENVGNYDINVGYAPNDNYAVTLVKGIYSITPKALKATLRVTGSKDYDGQANVSSYVAFDFDTDDLLSGDVGKVTIAGIVASANNVNAGTQSVTIDKSNISLENTSSDNIANNYTLSIVDTALSITINKVTLTISFTYENNSITYGESPVLKIDYLGFVNNEKADDIIATAPALMLNGDNLLNENGYINVGEYELFNSGAISEATINGSNYNLVYEEAKLNVAKKTLDVTFKGALVAEEYVFSATYTGKPFEFKVAYTGFVTGEDESVIKTDAVANAQDNYYKTASNTPYKVIVDVSTANADNYSFNAASEGAFTIKQAPLTIVYKGAEITFGDTLNTNVTDIVSYNGFVDNEDASVLASQPTIDFSGLAMTYGCVAVSNNGTELQPYGASSVNYSISYQSGTLKVSPKAITATFGKTITYGETLVATMDDITTVSGLVTGDSKASLTISAQDLSEYKDAGTHTISSSDITIVADNYTVTVSGSVTINKATLNIGVVLDKTSYTYGENVVVNIVYESFKYVEDTEETVFGENKPVISGLIKNSNGYVDAGTYTIKPVVQDSIVLDNYEIGNISAKQLKVDQASLTIAYKGDSFKYDGLAHVPSQAQVTITGFVANDSVNSIVVGNNIYSTLGTFVFMDVETFMEADGYMDVAEVRIKVSLTSEQSNILKNYTRTFVEGKLVITARPITFTADDKTQVYGNVATELTYQVSGDGYATGDDSTDFALTINRKTGNNVGEYAITITATNANYSITTIPATYTITARPIEVTFDVSNKVYNGKTDVAVSYVIANKVGEDDLTLTNLDANTADANVGENKVVTLSAFALDGEAKDNYTLDGATTNKDGLTITITKATLTVTITHKQASITEGDVVTQDDFSITYEGFVNGETESVLAQKVSVDCEEVKALVSGTHPIPYIGGVDTNYSFDYAGVGTIVVVPARTQIDTTNLIFVSETYTYNGENQFVAISWSDMPSYVSVAYSYTDALGNAVAEHKNVGSYKVTASFKVSNTDYYMETESYTVDMVIGAKDVTVTFDSTDLSKIYDGNTNITLASQPTVAGLLGEDSITYDLTAKFEDANVGVGKEITLNSTVATPVGATDLNNYNIILVGTDSLTADITAKDVTVTFSSNGLSKTYDGNTDITLDSQPTVAGLLGEDGITYDLTAKFEDANVGVGKEITLNSTVATPVGATDPNNYDISLVGTDSLTADITARKVDLTYTLNNTKTFDGTTALPEGNITNVEIVNAVDGETLSYTITGEYSSKNATLNDSTITITITKSIGGATAGNYYFEDGGIDTVDGKINQKQVTVILEEQTSVYKEAVVVDQNKWHLKEGDSIIEDLGIRIIKAATSENAGTYPLTATKSNDNYHVTFISANYVISQAVTEVKFDLMKQEFEYTGEAVAINMSNFYVYTNRDNITAGIVYPEFATDDLGNHVEIKNVGTYTLTFKVVNDTTDLIPDNFQEAEASVTISVLKATPTFDFTAVDQTIYRYNGAPQHITGVKSTNTDGAVVSYENNTFVDVPDGGVLTITVSVPETENYHSNTTTHNVTILKADYDLSGYAFDNAEYDYNGTTRSIMAVGLPSSITVSYTYGETTQDTPFAFKDAGIYIVKASYVIDERNYNYPTSLIASASLKINQINITVEVTHQEGYYGEEPEFDPAGIKVIAGNFVDGDPIDLDLKLEPKDSYPIGVYQLVATTTSSGNYNVTVARGSYTILPRPVTFRADNHFSEYGDEDAELTYSIDSSSPYKPLENDVFTVALTREEGKIPGKYAITGTIVNPNYAVTLLTRPEDDSHGTYTVLPRKITIVLYNQEGTKASQISKKGYKVSGGILRGDDLDIKVVPVDEIDSTPGEYQLTASYNENPNYDVTVKGAIFTLRLATKISVSNLIYTKLYDGVAYVFDAKVSSGAEPVFTVNGIFVENSFTEVGIYEIAITAPIVGDYAEPEQFTFTFEIRPTELIVEQAGITFILSKESGFGADETLDVHQTQEIVLSGENYTQEIDSAYTIYIVKGEERIPLEEYAQGEKVSLKIKLSDELQNLGVSTWFMDSEENVLHAVDAPSEDGFVEVALEGGSMHILFVAERGEAMPLLIIGCAMGLAFVILFFFYLFRKKAL
ncbi:MAG: hypothetical protein IKL86_03255 [Clostridia bacterium]|nr:hypothetical protein [Clostridia bacterium]